MRSRDGIDTPEEVIEQVPELANLIRDAARLKAERDAARADLKVAVAEVEQARAADVQAAADVARGKRKSARPTLGAAGERLAKAEGHVAALTLAAEDAEADLRAAIDQHREAIGSRLHDEAERQREQARQQAGRLSTLLADRAKVLALDDWLDSGRYAPGKFGGARLAIRKASGEALRVDTMVAEIEAALAPPPEPPKPPPVQPLRKAG